MSESYCKEIDISLVKIEEPIDAEVFSLEKLSYLTDLSKVCYQEAKDKGFHSGEINFGDFVANLHGEASELWEAYREGRLNEPCDKAKKMEENGLEVLNCISEELSDIVIRALDTAATMNINIGSAIYWKIMFNRTRSFRNGGKKA